MIRVDVHEYCAECSDFEAAVTKPEKLEVLGMNGEFEILKSDTVIRCRYSRRCETIKRYLEKQLMKRDGK